MLICFLVYLIGRRVVDEDTGLVGAALAAVYGYFIYYNVALMTETFFIVLVLFSLYLSLELKEKPTLARWIWLGLALGLASLLRQTILLFVPFLLLWLFWELKKAGCPLVVLHRPGRCHHLVDCALDHTELSGLSPVSPLKFECWLRSLCFQQS